jgi:hypothetical protein
MILGQQVVFPVDVSSVAAQAAIAGATIFLIGAGLYLGFYLVRGLMWKVMEQVEAERRGLYEDGLSGHWEGNMFRRRYIPSDEELDNEAQDTGIRYTQDDFRSGRRRWF